MAISLKLDDSYARPIAQVDLSVGTVYLYRIAAGDVTTWRTNEVGVERARHFLPRISSLQKRESFKEERQPLPDAVLAALTDDDVARIADALRVAFPSTRVRGKGEPLPNPEDGRREGESGFAYLDRILQAELSFCDSAYRATLRQVWERGQNLGGSVGEAFTSLRGTSDQLARTVLEAQRAFSPPKVTEIDTAPFRAMAEQERRRRAERDEEHEWSRLSLKVNTQSAEMLAQLVNTAGTMMVRWDDRDKRTDKQIRVQLWIAVVALVASTLLSALSTYYGYFTKVAYERDVAKEKSDQAAAKATSDRDERIARLLEQNAALLQQNAALMTRAQENSSPPRPKSGRGREPAK